jgi:hypothetical protein
MVGRCVHLYGSNKILRLANRRALYSRRGINIVFYSEALRNLRVKIFMWLIDELTSTDTRERMPMLLKEWVNSENSAEFYNSQKRCNVHLPLHSCLYANTKRLQLFTEDRDVIVYCCARGAIEFWSRPTSCYPIVIFPTFLQSHWTKSVIVHLNE